MTQMSQQGHCSLFEYSYVFYSALVTNRRAESITTQN